MIKSIDWVEALSFIVLISPLAMLVGLLLSVMVLR